MNTLLKWLVRLAMAGIILCGLVWASWHGFSLDKKLHTLVRTKLQTQIHRDIEWDAIRLGFFKLSIENLRLSEIPDFSKGTFVQTSRISVRVSPRSLWHGRVSLILHSPDMEWGSLKSRLSETALLVDSHFSAQDNAGRLSVQKIANPAYEASDFRIDWALRNIDPTLNNIDGEITLHQGPGRLIDVQRWAASSPGAKVALMPVVALQKVERLGFIKTGLPDLSKMTIAAIDGKYTIEKGSMTIQTFDINSKELTIKAGGKIHLPTERLAIDMNVKSPKETVLGDLDLHMGITGTLSSPKVDVKSLKKKMFKAAVGQLLRDPAAAKKNIDDALKNIFR